MLTPDPRLLTPGRPSPKPMPASARRSHPVLISLTRQNYDRLLALAGDPRRKSRIVAEALNLLDSIPVNVLYELRERQAMTGQTPGQQLAAAYRVVGSWPREAKP